MAANCCDSGLNPFGAKFYPQFILSQKSYVDNQSEENPELTRLMDVAAILMPKSLKSLVVCGNTSKWKNIHDAV